MRIFIEVFRSKVLNKILGLRRAFVRQAQGPPREFACYLKMEKKLLNWSHVS
jgi:hypothetical protein